MKVMLLSYQTALLSAAGTVTNALLSAISGESISGWQMWLDMQANVQDVKMKRSLVELDVPGREGGILQDMGAKCTVIKISGKWIYENKPDNEITDLIPIVGLTGLPWNWLRLQTMNALYRTKTPVLLASNLLIGLVMIDEMNFREAGGSPNVYEYDMTLKELNPLTSLVGNALGAAAVWTGFTGVGY